MKFISWNVNGMRAVMKKGFMNYFNELDADVFSVQEIKMKPEQLEFEMDGYHIYLNSAERPGYSGTATFTKEKPIAVTYGIGIEDHDKEGRILTLEFPKFYHVNCYTPNSKRGLERLEYRQVWEDEIKAYLDELRKKKPVVYCGDLNVAHKEIDLKNPSTNRKNAGFTDEEREKMNQLLEGGYIDTFRYFYPEKEEEYTWWSYLTKARERNAGWRIDYFITSEDLKDALVDASIHQEIMGSDHCPVELVLDLEQF